MKKKIAILGSTGSIGKTLLNIIGNDKKNFEVVLLTANKDYKTLIKQANRFKVKNIIITDKKALNIIKNKKNISKINILDSFKNLNEFLNNKLDYVMNSIVGIDGLDPTLRIIKHTKKIAIANKESIICAWNLIYEELVKNNTIFVPVDSEHFSIWYGIKDHPGALVEKIYLTASGGSLLGMSPKNKQVIFKKNFKTS